MNFNTILEELDKLYNEAIEETDTALEEAVTNEYRLVSKQGIPVVKDVFGSKEEAAAYANKYKIADVKISRTELVNGEYNGNYEYEIDENGNFVESILGNIASSIPTPGNMLEDVDTEEVEDIDDEEVDIEIIDDEEADEAASTVTKTVLECTECGGFDVVNSAAVVADKESELVNVGTPCRYCEAEAGYTVVGNLVTTDVADEEADSDTEGAADEDEASAAEE